MTVPSVARLGSASGTPALHVSSVTKSFGKNEVLRGLSLTVRPGEIRALLGENGSGKSTLIKILAGYHTADTPGAIHIAGRPMSDGSAHSSRQLGCRFVHQDLGLIDSLSIADNLYIGSGFPHTCATVRRRELYRRAAADLDRVGVDLDPGALVEGLAPVHRTGVAFARAMHADPDAEVTLLVLDEPTASLPEQEVEHLLEIVRRSANAGVGILYVTHRLDEVVAVADSATVLRDGAEVATTGLESVDKHALVTLLAGADAPELQPPPAPADARAATPALKVEGLVTRAVDGLAFETRGGEIVGIAGITGSGRETVLSALYGATRPLAGTVSVHGRSLKPGRPDLAMRAGVAYLPPDRRAHGGVMSLSARENLTLADLSPFWRAPLFHRNAERAEALRWFNDLGIRPKDAIEQPLSTFSGGNQQKILFGKWLRRRPSVMLLDEPTQGVDVSARADLHRYLANAAADGASVLVASSDIDELASICHRILVLRDGRLAVRLSGGEVSAVAISRACLGADDHGGDR